MERAAEAMFAPLQYQQQEVVVVLILVNKRWELK